MRRKPGSDEGPGFSLLETALIAYFIDESCCVRVLLKIYKRVLFIFFFNHSDCLINLFYTMEVGSRIMYVGKRVYQLQSFGLGVQ